MVVLFNFFRGTVGYVGRFRLTKILVNKDFGHWSVSLQLMIGCKVSLAQMKFIHLIIMINFIVVAKRGLFL